MNVCFNGTLFTGENLVPTAVTVEVANGRLHSLTTGVELEVAWTEVRSSDRLASLPRFLYLPGDRTIETADNDVIDTLLAGQRRGRIVAAVHWLEIRSRAAAAATLLLVAVVAVTAWWGLPVLARKAAMAVPASIEKQAGQAALLTINRLLGPSQLQPGGRTRVVNQLDRLLRARPLPAKPELVFRSMGGKFPNAFALPGGFLVVSDELVALANDEELAAVLAHEIGHWQLRHGLQGVLRSSAALLVVSTVTGDLSTLTTFAGTIPFALLQRGYSREFEEAADAYAVELLREAGINVAHFATILKKLEAARPDKGQDLTYLSTHPSTGDRIKRINPTGRLPAAVVVKTTELPAEQLLEKPGQMLIKVEQNKELITNLGRGATPPHPLSQPQPVYPPEMAAANLEGKVTIEFVIDQNGDVRNLRLVRSTHKEFEAPAIAAARQWKFTPAELKGRKIATLASQIIEFNLEDLPASTATTEGAAPRKFLRKP